MAFAAASLLISLETPALPFLQRLEIVKKLR
jgi:hypothetical protein